MFTKIIPIILALTFFSCAETKKENTSEVEDIVSENKIAKDTTSVKNINIQEFKEIPSDIEGCGCYFSLHKNEFDKKIYIFVDNYDNIAYVKIDGKMVQLLQIKMATINEKFTKIYRNIEYTLNINAVRTGIIDEIWQYEGALKLISENGEYSHGVYGECEC